MPEEIDFDEVGEEEEPEEEPQEEETTQVESAPKTEKDKSKRYELYEVEDGDVKRLKKSCPRCGPGIFMADHGERLSCGKCGYTEYKSS